MTTEATKNAKGSWISGLLEHHQEQHVPVVVWRPARHCPDMPKACARDLRHDDRRGNAMTAPIVRHARREARALFGREIDDCEAATRFERGQQAGIELVRTCQMMVDVAQEDRVTTFAGKVGRRLGAFQHHDIRQGVLRDGGSDLGELLRSDVRGVDASRRVPATSPCTTDIAPPPAPTSATIIPGLSASSSASCGTSRAACSRSCRTAVAGRCDSESCWKREDKARNVCAAASQLHHSPSDYSSRRRRWSGGSLQRRTPGTHDRPSILERSVPHGHSAHIMASHLVLTPGIRLGVYEVIASIGEGGMGQVFRARDTKLDRDVAIKILPEAFAHDADGSRASSVKPRPSPR